MKILISFFAILISTMFISCTKRDASPAANNGLVGKWKLVEALSDPGDGSGKFVSVREESSSIVEFRSDGSFREVKGIIYSSINPFNSYKILDDKRVQLSMKNGSKPDPVIWYYSDVTATTLTLGFGCTEPCSGKFIAVK
jgi:hypothetical protein